MDALVPLQLQSEIAELLKVNVDKADNACHSAGKSLTAL